MLLLVLYLSICTVVKCAQLVLANQSLEQICRETSKDELMSVTHQGIGTSGNLLVDHPIFEMIYNGKLSSDFSLHHSKI